ncbi:hypothetical protein ACJX0J_006215 [Zea mays]
MKMQFTFLGLPGLDLALVILHSTTILLVLLKKFNLGSVSQVDHWLEGVPILLLIYIYFYVIVAHYNFIKQLLIYMFVIFFNIVPDSWSPLKFIRVFFFLIVRI